MDVLIPEPVEFIPTYKEIFKLKKMLEDADISHRFLDASGGHFERYVILYPDINKAVCSVMQSPDSLGIENDSLELKGLLTEEEQKEGNIKGYLTAENVFERIQAAETSGGNHE